MKKEDVINAYRILEDLEEAEFLVKTDAEDLVFMEECSSGNKYYKFRTEMAINLINEFTRKLHDALKEELENYKGEDKE